MNKTMTKAKKCFVCHSLILGDDFTEISGNRTVCRRCEAEAMRSDKDALIYDIVRRASMTGNEAIALMGKMLMIKEASNGRTT